MSALAAAAGSGDAEAAAKLLRALAPDIVRGVHALMGAHHPDVDDVVQQALIGLVQALPAFRGECSVPHYTSRIVARTALAARRRAALRGERRDEEVEVDALVSAEAAPSEVLAARRRRGLVRQLLDELPEEQAETLALRVALGLSLAEVSGATGVPVNTVRSRVRLAKERLRRRIEADPELARQLELEGEP